MTVELLERKCIESKVKIARFVNENIKYVETHKFLWRIIITARLLKLAEECLEGTDTTFEREAIIKSIKEELDVLRKIYGVKGV